MLAVRIHRFGTDALRVEDVPEPVPERGQVLLRVRACSLNFRDWLILRGEYNPSYPLPLTLGSDAVGEVVAFGPDTDPAGLSLGDRVCPLLAQGWFDGDPLRSTLRHTLGGPLAGVFAERVVARVDSVVRIPDAIDDLQAACLPCAALTAYSALRVLDRVGPGHTLLTMGSGGVSVSAIAIGRAVGARVIATTRRPEKEARLLELGAETVVSSSAPGWGKRVRELAGGEGVDHVIEIGGAGTLDESLSAVRPGGTVSLIGVLVITARQSAEPDAPDHAQRAPAGRAGRPPARLPGAGGAHGAGVAESADRPRLPDGSGRRRVRPVGYGRTRRQDLLRATELSSAASASELGPRARATPADGARCADDRDQEQ